MPVGGPTHTGAAVSSSPPPAPCRASGRKHTAMLADQPLPARNARYTYERPSESPRNGYLRQQVRDRTTAEGR